MTPLADEPNAKPTGVRWGVFVLACGTSWLLYFHRYTFALIKPDLKREWNLGTDELGVLDSAFSVSYSTFQIPLGIAGDALGVRLVLSLLIAVWCVGFGLHAYAPSTKVLAVARGAFGLGQSAAYACLNRISRNWFPEASRTSLQGWIAVFFGRIGGLSANILFGAVLMGVFGFDWRPLVYVAAALGLIYAAVFWYVFRERPREHPWANEAETQLIEGTSPVARLDTAAPRPSVLQMLRRTSRRSIGNLLALNLQTILSTAADNIYSNWIPLFLAEVYLFDETQRGTISALPLLGGAIGGAAGGFLNDLLIRRIGNRKWGRRIVGGGGKGMASVLILVGLMYFDRPYVFCGVLFLVKLFSDSGLATTWGTVTDIGGRTTATVFAFNNAVAGVGSMAAPLVYGFIAEHHGWQPVFVAAAACYAVCGLSWLVIDCTKPVVDESRGA
jgi:MFS family permease